VSMTTHPAVRGGLVVFVHGSGRACEVVLDIVAGATHHLFEEPGALDGVAALAGAWFERCLPMTVTPR
jgi:hypothetical protein